MRAGLVVAASFLALVVQSDVQAGNATRVVHCPASAWEGVSISRRKAGFETDVDRISYGATTYIFEPIVGGGAKVLFDDKTTEAIVLNRYDRGNSYTVLTYVYGGVATMDTVYDSGLVINQVTKASIGMIPMGSIISRNMHAGEIEVWRSVRHEKGPEAEAAINSQFGSTDRCRTLSDGPRNLRPDLTGAQLRCLSICNPVSGSACCQPSHELQNTRLQPERWPPFSCLSQQLLRWRPIPLLRQR